MIIFSSILIRTMANIKWQDTIRFVIEMELKYVVRYNIYSLLYLAR